MRVIISAVTMLDCPVPREAFHVRNLLGPTTMLLRFTVLQTDRFSHVWQGLLQAAQALRKSDQLDCIEEMRIEVTFAWFNRHLPVPTRFARSRRPRAQAKAVSWFKDTAHEFIAGMQELAAVLTTSASPPPRAEPAIAARALPYPAEETVAKT